LGTGQLSLAKFLFITADETNRLNTHHIHEYLTYIFERIDLTRDLHFDTNTTIDTLDYSGTGLNSGSKLVLAAYGEKIRELGSEIPAPLDALDGFYNAKMVMPGVVAIQTKPFADYDQAEKEMYRLNTQLENAGLENIAQIVICDDSSFLSASMNNYLWITYTRCNPSHDIYGIRSFHSFKHWGCRGPVVFDARLKPHHAPPVEKDPQTEEKVDRLFQKGGSLYKVG
jgi:4-hydroxy-3-polyprenylbenzoate decarboxylase